jgi:hypothetical protein
MHHILKCLLAASVLACATHAQAADRVWHPYREVCEKLLLVKFFELPEAERDHLQVFFKTPTVAPDGQPVLLTINGATRQIRVTPDATGLIEFPFDRQLLAENPDILVNLPAGQTLTLSLELRPTLPRELKLDYVEFMSALPQANAMIRRQAGRMSLFAPSMRKLVLHYEHPLSQQVSIGVGQTSQLFKVSKAGDLSVPFDEARMTANSQVTISDLPQSMDLAE